MTLPKNITQDELGCYWLHDYIGVFLDEDGKWKGTGVFKDTRTTISEHAIPIINNLSEDQLREIFVKS